MALTRDPKRCAVMAMDFQKAIVGMTPTIARRICSGPSVDE